MINKTRELQGAGLYPSYRLNQRERKVLQTAEQYDPASDANWGPTPPESLSAALDQLAESGAASATAMQTASVLYDFSVHGGAISSIPLGVTLPDNAVVVEVIRDELIAADSGDDNGTIVLSTPTDGNLEQTALAANGGAITLASSGGSAVPKKLSAARELQVTIATTALSAGRVRYFVRYYLSE